MQNNNLGKFFGPSASFTGYALIAGGLIALSYSLMSLTLIIPGIFMAFTYTGTIIDPDKRRVKPYTSLFGIFKTGKWIEVTQFTKFSIERITKKYSTYSRGNVKFDMDIIDLRLMLVNKSGKKKVVLNHYSKFEYAQKEKDELSKILFPDNKLTENNSGMPDDK